MGCFRGVKLLLSLYWLVPRQHLVFVIIGLFLGDVILRGVGFVDMLFLESCMLKIVCKRLGGVIVMYYFCLV